MWSTGGASRWMGRVGVPPEGRNRSSRPAEAGTPTRGIPTLVGVPPRGGIDPAEAVRDSTMSQCSRRRVRPIRGLAALLLAVAWAGPAAAGAVGDDPAATEFFEKEIRPLLAEKCQKCHGGSKPRAGLSL